MKEIRKMYVKPQAKAYEVKTSGIICTSPNSTNQNEEYETGDTSDWF